MAGDDALAAPNGSSWSGADRPRSIREQEIRQREQAYRKIARLAAERGEAIVIVGAL